MKFSAALIAIAAIVFLMTGCVTTQEQAKPLTVEESAIHQTFQGMETAWKNLDKDKFMAFISDEASMMTGRDRYIVSKADMAATFPDKMRALGPIKYMIRSVKIDGNEAVVKLKAVLNNNAYPQTWTMINENNAWLVKKNRY